MSHLGVRYIQLVNVVANVVYVLATLGMGQGV